MVTKGDLVGKNYGTNDKGFLLCTGDCGGQFSANEADYFWMRDDDVFKCCNEPMVLAKEVRTVEILKE